MKRRVSCCVSPCAIVAALKELQFAPNSAKSRRRPGRSRLGSPPRWRQRNALLGIPKRWLQAENLRGNDRWCARRTLSCSWKARRRPTRLSSAGSPPFCAQLKRPNRQRWARGCWKSPPLQFCPSTIKCEWFYPLLPAFSLFISCCLSEPRQICSLRRSESPQYGTELCPLRKKPSAAHP